MTAILAAAIHAGCSSNHELVPSAIIIAIRTMFDAAERDPAVIEAMRVGFGFPGEVWDHNAVAALRALRAHVLSE